VWNQEPFQQAVLTITDRADGGQTVTGTSMLDLTGFWAIHLAVTEAVRLDAAGRVETWSQQQVHALGSDSFTERLEIDTTSHTASQGLADHGATMQWSDDGPVLTWAYPSDPFFGFAHPTPVAAYVTTRAARLNEPVTLVLPALQRVELQPAWSDPTTSCFTWFGDQWCVDADDVPIQITPGAYGAPVDRDEVADQDLDDPTLYPVSAPAPTIQVTRRDCSVPRATDTAHHLTYAVTSADGTAIAGRLLLPDGRAPFPTVVLEAGGQGADRHGDAGPNAHWDCVAHDLLAQGIAVASFDDRGWGASGGSPNDSFDGRTDDVVAVATWVDARDETGALFLLGHAEGAAWVSAAEPAVPGADGVILVAGISSTGGDLWVEQGQVYLQNLGFPTEQIRSLVGSRQSTVDQILGGTYGRETLDGLPVADFWSPWFAFDGTALAQATTGPVLVIQGGSDWEVPSHHAQALYQALHGDGRDVTLNTFPSLGHQLQPAIGPAPMGLEYTLPWSWDPSVTSAVATWVGDHAGGSGQRRAR